MKAKIIILSALSAASFGLVQAANAGWDAGPCSNHSGGPVPCIDWGDGPDERHFNGDGGHAGDWHGHPGGGDFQFTGYTDLGCDLGQFYCQLTLNGEVRKFYDGTDWRIGVRVNSGSVAQGSQGDNECANISVTGFPWYVGNYPTDHTFGPSSGIIYTGSSGVYTGNVGNIGVTYTVFGVPIPLVTGGHMHEVEYHNSNSSFRFGGTRDNVIYVDGIADNNSGCTVEGDLVLQNGDYLHLH